VLTSHMSLAVRPRAYSPRTLTEAGVPASLARHRLLVIPRSLRRGISPSPLCQCHSPRQRRSLGDERSVRVPTLSGRRSAKAIAVLCALCVLCGKDLSFPLSSASLRLLCASALSLSRPILHAPSCNKLCHYSCNCTHFSEVLIMEDLCGT
jgi:hypothetical protein